MPLNARIEGDTIVVDVREQDDGARPDFKLKVITEEGEATLLVRRPYNLSPISFFGGLAAEARELAGRLWNENDRREKQAAGRAAEPQQRFEIVGEL